jgi:2,4-dienoyl-CoA reductase-like NADH-dependent reductase (Old Yellow Enzyme family)
MKRKYPHLCSPIQIGSLTYRNRMASSPLATPFITREGYMTWEGAAFYEERAKGGAASVTVTEGVTHPETGQNYRRQLTLTDEDSLGMLAVAATSIKRHGAIAALELSHGGKYIDIDIQQGYKSKSVIRYGPSDEEVSEQDGVLVREMPKKILREVVKSFAVGADFARRAGFDLIVLHGGHGWLINQFLSPAVNRRTDEYGGSIANRARLALEILDSIRSVVGSRIPIEFRLSAEEFVEGGYELGEAIEIAKLLEPKIDLLHVSAGSHESAFARTHLPVYARRGELVHYAAELKKHVRVPVAAIGALNDPEEMERIIAEGKADIVVMGRALIADPQLPNKVIQGRDDEIIKCIRCFDCMAERIAKRTRSCAVNPIIGRELEPRESVSRNPRKVLVVGGGPAACRRPLPPPDAATG